MNTFLAAGGGKRYTDPVGGGDSYVAGSSAEFSSGSGSTTGGVTTASVKAGAYFSYEHEGSILGIVKLTKQEFEAARNYGLLLVGATSIPRRALRWNTRIRRRSP